MKVGCGLPSPHFLKWQQQGYFSSPDNLSLQTTSPSTEHGVRNDKEGQSEIWPSCSQWALRLIVREALAPPDVDRPLLFVGKAHVVSQPSPGTTASAAETQGPTGS